jgi:hypothetical protein
MVSTFRRVSKIFMNLSFYCIYVEPPTPINQLLLVQLRRCRGIKERHVRASPRRRWGRRGLVMHSSGTFSISGSITATTQVDGKSNVLMYGVWVIFENEWGIYVLLFNIFSENIYPWRLTSLWFWRSRSIAIYILSMVGARSCCCFFGGWKRN